MTLISAFPDADPEVLRLFAHRYTILEERRIASVVLDDDLEVETLPETRSLEAPVSEGHGDPAGKPADPTATIEEDANHV